MRQKDAGGNCRGRLSSLSEIVQIVTSAVRVLWAKIKLVVDLTCLFYKLVSSAIKHDRKDATSIAMQKIETRPRSVRTANEVHTAKQCILCLLDLRCSAVLSALN